MRDRQTNTVWAQFDGTTLSPGPLAGERLSMVPMPMMTWAGWLATHPDTLVADTNTPFQRQYGNPRPGVGRLSSETLVVGVEVRGEFGAFPLVDLEREGGVLNTQVGGQAVVVIYDGDIGTGVTFDREVDGKTLTFESLRPPGGERGPRLVDVETGSGWDITGRSIDGPLAGKSLNVVTSFVTESYAWDRYHLEGAAYQRREE